MAVDSVAQEKPLHLPLHYGELPKHWQWSRLDDICEGVFDCPHSTPELTEDGPYVARTQDIAAGRFRFERAARVSENTYRDRVARVVPSLGDLLYSREGTYFGIAAEVPKDTRVCLGQRMVLIRPDAKRLNHSFLRYWLNSPVMAAHMHGYRDGTVAERLNLPTIRALPVLVPPMRDQERIARVLCTLDDKIELNRRMNATLEGISRAIFKSWFVDFDPVRQKAAGQQPVGMDAQTAAMFPDSFEESEIGEVPTGWAIQDIESLCEFLTSGGTPARKESAYWEGGDVSWFKTGELLDGPLLESEEKVTRAGLENSSCKLWPENTVLFALYASPTVGRLGVLTQPATANQAAAALKAKPEYGTAFLVNTLLEAREKLQRIAVGAAQQNINQGILKAHAVVAPPVRLTTVFSQWADEVFSKRTALARQSRTLAALRDTLLPKLLSGEIRVPEAEEAVR